jgi:hypothetical protein
MSGKCRQCKEVDAGFIGLCSECYNIWVEHVRYEEAKKPNAIEITVSVDYGVGQPVKFWNFTLTEEPIYVDRLSIRKDN